MEFIAREELALLIVVVLTTGASRLSAGVPPPPPAHVIAASRQLRIDLVWDQAGGSPVGYDVRRSATRDGVFEPIPAELTNVDGNVYSDFIGRSGQEFYYQVRSFRSQGNGQPAMYSDWSPVCHARSQPLDQEQLLTEVEEAGFRYFYNYGYPGSGLSRVGTHLSPNVCSSGGTGQGLCNLVVGAQRAFITRPQAAARVLQILHFLSFKADRFHGAFPHWLDGETGKTLAFSQDDDGADIVETAFLMQGVLLCREYFSGRDNDETSIRNLADSLWRQVEWDWFAKAEDGRHFLVWHWSPDHGWRAKDRISGFNECQIAYILGMASPSHRLDPACYWQGWEVAGYGNPRTQFGVPLELAGDFGPPLFWTEYSYLALDPRQISYHGKAYFELFQNICRVGELYAQTRKDQFPGYGELWGWSAGYGPDGYAVFAPGPKDNGTINPDATLAAMPYAPAASRSFLLHLYLNKGRELWGPFGFYDCFNLSRGWRSRDYLDEDVGPIAPMIENSRSGLCWRTFMKAPEIAPVLKLLANDNK